MRAAVYTRISEDTGGLALGVVRQEIDCFELCQQKGWDMITPPYEDNDFSAFSGKPRPAYERLVEDIKAGLVDAVVAWHPDRLHRSPVELESFIDLIDASGVTVTTVTAGDWDLSTPDGRMTARILGSIARRESEHKSVRIKRKHRELAEMGKAMGGSKRPYGYEWIKTPEGKRKGLRVVPAERLRIQEAARRVLAGESPYAVTQDWNGEGVPTVTGVAWNRATLRRILVSPMVAGYREHNGELTRPTAPADRWEAILDDDTWRRLRAILLDPARAQTRVPRRYLLGGGLLRCGECGGRLDASPYMRKGKPTVRRYACRPFHGGCGKVAVVAEPVEQIVSAQVMRALSDPAFLERLHGGGADPDERAVAADLAAAERDLEQLSRDHYVDKLIGRAEFFAARGDLVARIDQAKRLAASVTRRRPVAVLAGVDDIEAQWETLGLERQRALISLCIESVPIASARGRRRGTFDPSRVGEPTWRV